MSWLTFVLLALVLIFAIQGFRKGLLRMVISMVFFLMVLGVTSWLNPYISDFVREHTSWQSGIEENATRSFWNSWKAGRICKASRDRYPI